MSQLVGTTHVGRREHRGAVHIPDRGVAIGVVPEDVAVAVPVEVTGTGNRPARRNDAKIGLSPSTAHEHFETAKKKLKASTRAEAIAWVSLAIVAP
jgi:hypothetical protein